MHLPIVARTELLPGGTHLTRSPRSRVRFQPYGILCDVADGPTSLLVSLCNEQPRRLKPALFTQKMLLAFPVPVPTPYHLNPPPLCLFRAIP